MAQTYVKKGLFRIGKPERKIPIAKRKRIVKFLKLEGMKKVQDYIERKEKQVNLKEFIPETTRKLLKEYSLQQAPGILAIEIHARIIDALDLPKNKAIILKNAWALNTILSKATVEPIMLNTAIREAKHIAEAATALLNEARVKQKEEKKILSAAQYYYSTMLKSLEKAKPNTKIMVPPQEFEILRNILGAFTRRYLNEEQFALLDVLEKQRKDIMETREQP